jgi:predicted ATPase/DNA-binding SARP family transcriptional activator
MPSIRVFLFGAPRVERDGEAIHIPRRKSMALLAYLAATGQPHSRDALATMFWPENDQSTARANLRRELSRLKKALGGVEFSTINEQVGFQREAGFYLDIEDYQTRLEDILEQIPEGNGTPGSRSMSICSVELSQAVAIYTGDFMAGFSLPDSPQFDEWQFFQSENLRRSLAEALQRLIRWLTIQGEYEGAIDPARRWLALDSLHEPAHRQLMELYAWSGQQAAALRQYQECVRIFEEELGLAPEEETTALYEAIRTKQFSVPDSSTPQPDLLPGDSPALRPDRPARHNLPFQVGPFIGREEELADIKRLLLDKPDHRLVTVLGPGGIGKTRLAIESARPIVDRFADGVYFAPMAPLNSAENIVFALAESIGFQFYEAENPKQQLLDYLRGKQMLLLVDNFEHLLEGAERLAEILQATPNVKILATSRERLGLTGETLYMIGGMPYPQWTDSAEVLEYEAVKLLIQCVRMLHPDFEPGPEEASAIIRICQLVQGMPLALVLAAGWIEVLSFDEIAAEIAKSLDFLETEMRDVPERQRSVRAVFDYSWKLLTEEQQRAFMKLCVFRGGFTRQAAQAVAGASLRTLLLLVNKSWLQHAVDGHYQIHELLRQYAQEKLSKDETAWHQARTQHSAYYVNLLVEVEGAMKGPGQEQAFGTIAEEFENIRVAWYWLVEQQQVESAVQSILPALFRYCEARARSFELLQLLQAARSALEHNDATANPRVLAKLLTAQAAFFRNVFPVRFEIFGMLIPAEEETLQEAWSLARTAEDLQAMGFWGILLTYLYGRIIDLHQGIERLRQLVSYLRPRNMRWELAFALGQLAQLLEFRFDSVTSSQEIEACAQEALDIFQELSDEREFGYTMRSYGQLRRLQHLYPQAIEYWQVAQEKLQAVGDWAVAADINWQIGDIHLQLGEFEIAFRYYQKMGQIYIEKGYKRTAAHALSKESYEALRYSDIDHARRTRQQSLTYSRQVGDSFNEAWSLWEMGEIYRVMGNYDDARRCYEDAKTILDKFDDRNFYIFYHRGLGDIALVRSDFDDAASQFGESLKQARAADHAWGMSYAFTGLGRAAIGLGDHQAARGHLLEALLHAKRADEHGIALVALGGVAEFLAARDEAERAYEMGTFVVNHHVSWRETKERATAIQELVKASLASDLAAVAQERSRNLNIWGEVDRLMNEL